MLIWEASKPNARYSFATAKNSTLKRFFTMSMLKLFESGQMDFSKSGYLKTLPNCKPLREEAESLSFKKICSVFYLMGAGFLLAGLVLILEKLSFRNRPGPKEIKPKNYSNPLLQQVMDKGFAVYKNNMITKQDYEKMTDTMLMCDTLLKKLQTILDS